MAGAVERDLSAEEIAWLRVILHSFATANAAPAQKAIVDASGAEMGTDVITRFLDPDGVGNKKHPENENKKQPKTIQRYARTIMKGLRTLIETDQLIISSELEKIRPGLIALFPDLTKLSAAKELPAPQALSDMPQDVRVMLDQLVWSTNLPRNRPSDDVMSDAMLLLQGFWFILRPASSAHVNGADAGMHQVSLSLLRIVPQVIERTHRYPIFKMRQAGNSNKHNTQPFTFGGVLSPSLGEALFVGRWRDKDRFFAMVADYTTDDLHPRRDHLQLMSGSMLGITSDTDHVGAPFVGVFIPNTAEIAEQDFKELEGRYAQCVNTVGLDTARKHLEDAGVALHDDNWAGICSQLRLGATKEQ